MISEQDVPRFPHDDHSVRQVQGYPITTAESHASSHQPMQNQGWKRHYTGVRQISLNKWTAVINPSKKSSAMAYDAVAEEVGDETPLTSDVHDAEGMDEPHDSHDTFRFVESSETMAGIQSHKIQTESSQTTNDSSPGGESSLESDGRSPVVKRKRIQPSPTTSGEAPKGHPEKPNILDVVHWYRQVIPSSPQASELECKGTWDYTMKKFTEPFEGEKIKVIYINRRIPGFVVPLCYKTVACQVMDYFKRELASCTVDSVDVRSVFFIEICRLLYYMRHRTYASLSEREARGWISLLRKGETMGIELPALRALVGKAWLRCVARDTAEKEKSKTASLLARAKAHREDANSFLILIGVIKAKARWHLEEANRLVDEARFVKDMKIPPYLMDTLSLYLKEWEANKDQRMISEDPILSSEGDWYKKFQFSNSEN